MTLGGFTLKLACDGSGEPTLTGIGSVTGSLIRGMRVTVSGAFQGGSSNSTAGVPVTILSPGEFRGGVAWQYAQPDGREVSVNLHVDDTATINGFDGCNAAGSAIATG